MKKNGGILRLLCPENAAVIERFKPRSYGLAVLPNCFVRRNFCQPGTYCFYLHKQIAIPVLRVQHRDGDEVGIG